MDNKSDELARLYKEAGWHNLRYSPGMFLEGMRKTTKNLSQLVSGPIFEPGTSQIRSRSDKHSSTMFGSLLIK
jgi:hypothetical protein